MGSSGELLLAHRDGARDVGAVGAVLQTTVCIETRIQRSLGKTTHHNFLDTPSTTRSKRDQSLPASVANTHFDGILPGKNVASPANSAKPSVPRKPSQSKPRNAQMAREGPRGTTLI